MITDDVMQKIIDTAHQLPYGDVLVEFLKLFIEVFTTHYHAYSGLPPSPSSKQAELTTYKFENMLSESVRIN